MARLLPLVIDAIDVTQPEEVLSLFECCDAIRKPDRMKTLFETAKMVTEFDQMSWFNRLDTVLGVDAGTAAQTAKTPAEIKQVVRRARLLALI
jgi:hypothetical protein